MKIRLELDKTEIENIVKTYCDKELGYDEEDLISAELCLIPSEQKGKREYKFILEYDKNREEE